jgi:tetratricopeptide (TPR) repeat protein
MTTAEEILESALADPRNTLEAGEAYLRELPEDAFTESSMTLRAMSLAARYHNEVEYSIELARRSSEEAARGELDDLRLLALLTMTGSFGVAGRYEEALAVVDEVIAANPEAEPVVKFRFQRGGIYSMMGRASEAVDIFESVLPLFRESGDTASLEITLGLLGSNLTHLGRLDEAEEYLMESFRLANELGEAAAMPSIEHNLGVLAAYRGDIPTALAWLQKSDDGHMAISGSPAPQHVARCEVLMSVGLFAEAQSLATRIARADQASGDLEHAINALIVAAESSLLGGSTQDALELSTEAQDLTAGTTDVVRNARAKRIADEARFAIDGPSRELLDDVTAIAEDLAASGQMVAAGQAYLLGGRVAFALQDGEAARDCLGKVAKVQTGPIETRLQAHLARALIRMSRAEPRGAVAAARSGLDLLDEYQAALGASDLRSGIERQGAELARIGLQLALESGRPRRILEWLDRTRGRALRYQPVVPTADDDVANALAQLRRVESELRRSENRDDRTLNLHRKRLQDEIVRADRIRRETKTIDARFSIAELIESLGDRTLVEFGEHEGRLFAVRVKRARARLIELGAAEETVRGLGHLRFAMRRGARRGRPVDLEALHRLDQMLFDDQDLGDDVVVVPPPSLIAAPWAALPSLRGRSVQISPSAEMWWQARRGKPTGDSVVIAGGPDLELADHEVEAVGRLHARATVLRPGVGVDEVRSALAGSAIAHIASHATFQVQNPMFSSLRLGDGDLNVYDIERLHQPPGLVVLSACDSGYTETRAGDELAGLTSALLSMGSQSVVASVGLVPDAAATSDLMIEFHRGLIQGLGPARALSLAQEGMLADPERFVSAASFICVGA